jgi:hypothetical protein
MSADPVEGRARKIFQEDVARCRRFLAPDDSEPRYDTIPPYVQQTYVDLAARQLAMEMGA